MRQRRAGNSRWRSSNSRRHRGRDPGCRLGTSGPAKEDIGVRWSTQMHSGGRSPLDGRGSPQGATAPVLTYQEGLCEVRRRREEDGPVGRDVRVERLREADVLRVTKGRLKEERRRAERGRSHRSVLRIDKLKYPDTSRLDGGCQRGAEVLRRVEVSAKPNFGFHEGCKGTGTSWA